MLVPFFLFYLKDARDVAVRLVNLNDLTDSPIIKSITEMDVTRRGG